MDFSEYENKENVKVFHNTPLYKALKKYYHKEDILIHVKNTYRGSDELKDFYDGYISEFPVPMLYNLDDIHCVDIAIEMVDRYELNIIAFHHDTGIEIEIIEE